MNVQAAPLPDIALLNRYAEEGCYTDCFVTEVAGEIPFSIFVEAFYTTRLFRLERWMISKALDMPASNDDAQQLALGINDRYSAWRVESRNENQLLMTDYRGETRSWLMSSPCTDRDVTRIYFGSAIVPKSEDNQISGGYRALLWFHLLYSVALLSAAKNRLRTHSV